MRTRETLELLQRLLVEKLKWWQSPAEIKRLYAQLRTVADMMADAPMETA
jgi:hypothetical protein